MERPSDQDDPPRLLRQVLGQVVHTVPGPKEGMPLWSLRFCVGGLQISMSEVYLLLVIMGQNIRFI